MGITTNNYRKEIGLFHNKRNNDIPNIKQQRALLRYLARTPDVVIPHNNTAVMFKLLMLLANVSQGSHVTLNSNTKTPVSPKPSNNGTGCSRVEVRGPPGDALAYSSLHYDNWRQNRNDVYREGNYRHSVYRRSIPGAGLPKDSSTLKRMKTRTYDVYETVNAKQYNVTVEQREPEYISASARPGKIKNNKNDTDTQYSLKQAPGRIITNNLLSTFNTLSLVYNNHYPWLLKTAAIAMKTALKERTGMEIDPDQTYFLRFTSAINDPTSITGWRHEKALTIESRTLTECVLHNFPADAQDNLDVVDQMTGIYPKSALGAQNFGGENQISVKPSVIAKIIMKMDFYNYYVEKLQQYWKTDIPGYINLAHIVVSSSRMREVNSLHAELLLQAFNIIPAPEPIKKYLLDINGYQSTDILVMVNARMQHAIYLPGEDESFVYFNDALALKRWIIGLSRNDTQRERFASHFSIYNRQDGVFYQGVDRWLASFAESRGNKDYTANIGFTRHEITEEPLLFITRRQKKQVFSDADNLIKSRSEVRRDMAIRYFSVGSMLFPNPITPLISLGLDLDKMLRGDNTEERHEGMLLVVDDCVNIALMCMGALIERRFSFAPGPPVFSAAGDATLSGLLRDEMSLFARRRQEVSGLFASKRTIPAIPPARPVRFGKRSVAKLGALGVKESQVAISRLSAPDLFGLRQDPRGGQYIVINNRPFRINAVKHNGYYLLGEHNEAGIFFNNKLNKYQVIELRKWQPALAPPCRQARSIDRASFHYCLRLSVRVRKVLDKHVAASRYNQENEMTLVYDQDKNLYIDTVHRQKYIAYADRFFPVQECGNGYHIFSSLSDARNEKLIRVFFGNQRSRKVLITRMERIAQIFTLPLPNARRFSMRLIRPLTAMENQALEDYRTINGATINDAMIKQAENPSDSTVNVFPLPQQIEQIHHALAKIKPVRCTVYKMGRIAAAELKKIRKNDIFVTDSFVLTDITEQPNPGLEALRGPDHYPVSYALEMKKRGFPVNPAAEGVTDNAIMIADKTYFKVTDIYEHYVTLREMDTGAFPQPVSSTIRRLDFVPQADAYAGLREEAEQLRQLLREQTGAHKTSTEYTAKYLNVLYSMAEEQVHSTALEEYTEAGSDDINNSLRFRTGSPSGASGSIDVRVRELLADYGKLHDFDNYAYRSVTYPADVYGRVIRTGDVVMDKGFMSASALPGNSIEWKDSWSRYVGTAKGDQIIMILDRDVPKKIAGTGFLVDHILIKPETPLKVVSIITAEDHKGAAVKIVCVGMNRSSRPVKDIYSGAVLSSTVPGQVPAE